MFPLRNDVPQINDLEIQPNVGVTGHSWHVLNRSELMCVFV